MNTLKLPQRPNLNWRLIVPVVSGALAAVAAGMLVCFLVALIGGDGGILAFGLPTAGLIPLAVLGLGSARRLRSVPLRARDGFLAVTLAWFAAAAAGSAPFLIEGTLPHVNDAFFESMSGITTTGATLIDRVEPLPDAMLLWRSVSQWLGGVGIVVLVVAIAPAIGLATQRVFFAETSGVTTDRLTPRIADTAKIISSIYVVLTAAGFVAFWIAGMGPFDAINHGMTTIATGGFSTKTGSIGAFDSLAIEIVVIVFMAIAGVNFAFYWRAMRGGEIWPQAAEVRVYVGILIVSIAALTLSLGLSGHPGTTAQHLRDAAFTATSITSSTAFVTADFDAWNDFARAHLLLLMFIGGCAGSTAGGIKVIRLMLLAKTMSQEVGRHLRPTAVQVLRVRGKVYTEDVRRGVLGFLTIFLTVIVIGTLAMLACGLDFVTAISCSIATLTIVGTGMGDIGATDNYSSVPASGRAVLSLLMLVGRLEIFTVLVLFTPAFWRPNVA